VKFNQVMPHHLEIFFFYFVSLAIYIYNNQYFISLFFFSVIHSFSWEFLGQRSRRESPTMASPSEDQPKKEPGDQSSPTGNAPGSRNHQPEMGYPPVMGYPNPNPHWQLPGNPPPYHGYPYHYVQPPPRTHYPPDPYASPMPGFVRGCLMVMTAFVFLSFVSTVMVWLILRPELPVFRVAALSVSDFKTASNSDFTASWAVDVTVENPNHKLNVFINQIDSFVYYNDYILTSSLKAESLLLNPKGHGVLHVTLSTNNTDDRHVVDEWVVDDMGEDRNGGSVSFDLRMLVSSTFKSGGWWARGGKLKVFCDNLNVGFVGANGNGTLPPEKPGACSVYA
jgi:LEA14-like dessication related protein